MLALELAFAKKSLRLLCENKAKAEQSLGARIAKQLRQRLADMRAATCTTDLVAGTPRKLEGNRRQQMSVDICDGYRMIFCANHNSNPLLDSGDVDWTKVSRVKIVRIEEYDA